MRFSLLVAAALSMASLAASAATITYTESVTASGSLNGVSFANQLLTLNATADSNTIGGGNGLFEAPTSSFGGTVATLGGFTLVPGAIFANQTNDVVGLNSGTSGDILDTVNTAFSSYNLASNIGPISGTAESSLQAFLLLTGGTLQIRSIGNLSTFQAVVTATPPPPSAVTPEPSSIALLGTGLLGVAGVMRKRFV